MTAKQVIDALRKCKDKEVLIVCPPLSVLQKSEIPTGPVLAVISIAENDDVVVINTAFDG